MCWTLSFTYICPHLHFLKTNMNYYAPITDFGKFFLETVFFKPVNTFFFLNR